MQIQEERYVVNDHVLETYTYKHLSLDGSKYCQYKDMLQLMMDATGEEEQNVEGEVDSENTQDQTSSSHPAYTRGPSKLTNEQIVAEAVGLMMAGYDTTANALAYTCYLLALNPDIQKKLQSEIDDYFDNRPVCYRTI